MEENLKKKNKVKRNKWAKMQEGMRQKKGKETTTRKVMKKRNPKAGIINRKIIQGRDKYNEEIKKAKKEMGRGKTM